MHGRRPPKVLHRKVGGVHNLFNVSAFKGIALSAEEESKQEPPVTRLGIVSPLGPMWYMVAQDLFAIVAPPHCLTVPAFVSSLALRNIRALSLHLALHL